MSRLSLLEKFSSLALQTGEFRLMRTGAKSRFGKYFPKRLCEKILEKRFGEMRKAEFRVRNAEWKDKTNDKKLLAKI